MGNTRAQKPMLAQSAGAVAAGARPSAPRLPPEPRRQPPAPDPDRVVDEILSLLGAEKFQTARRLARDAVKRYPDHARVRRVWAIFDPRGKARAVSGGPEPSTDEEFAWLARPPAWARGKWVALVGSEAVAAADTLAEVLRVVRSKDLPRRPLVHRIAELG